MTTPLAYHRLALSRPRPRWWHPLTVLLLALLLYLVSTVLVLAPTAVVSALWPDAGARVDRALATDDLSDPLGLAVMLAVVAMMLPAALLAVRWAGRRPVGTLSSVTGRLRGRLLARCLGVGLALVVPSGLVLGLVEGGGAAPVLHRTTLPILVVGLLLVPFQAAAEEYVFRGLAMQTVGAWLRHPAFAIVVPAPFFAVGHDYGALGQVDVVVFALVTGWVSWRTGGLEAAIGLHVAVNLTYVWAGAFGIVDLDATDSTVAGVAVSAGVAVVYAWTVRTWGDPGRGLRDGARGGITATYGTLSRQ
jgi:membrane protease YdiL (CAAX protease family)